MNEKMLKNIETTQGNAYKRGVQYEVANGDVIPNLGEKKFKGVRIGVRGGTGRHCAGVRRKPYRA